MTEDNKTAVKDGSTRRKRKAVFFTGKFFKRFTAAVLILTFLIWWNLFRNTSLKISKETTVYTEPLCNDGKEVDYFGALERQYPQEMKTDKNAARKIVRAIGIDGDILTQYAGMSSADFQLREKRCRFIYDRLGLDYDLDRPKFSYQGDLPNRRCLEEKYPGPKNEAKRLSEMKKWQQMTNENRPFDYDPEWCRQWMLKNTPALDAIADAVMTSEICQFPILIDNADNKYGHSPSLIGMFIPNFHLARSYGRALCWRALMHLQNEEYEKAVKDIIAAQKLGNMIGQNRLFIFENLFGTAIEQYSFSVPYAVNIKKQPTKEILQRLMDQPDPIMDNYSHILQNEKLFVLQTVSLFAQRDRDLNDLLYSLYASDRLDQIYMFKMISWLGFDWNYIIKQCNESFDQFITSESDRSDWEENDLFVYRDIVNKKAPYKFYTKLLLRSFTLRSRSDLAAKWIRYLLFPTTNAWRESRNRIVCCNHLYKIGLAMQLYRSEHGTFPPAFTVDKNGRPLHSWRVLLLPYLGKEADEIYRQIRLNEPWDSEYNKQFHNRTFPVYQCDSLVKHNGAEKMKGQTSYSVIIGPDTFFNGSGQGIDPARLIKEKPGRDWSKIILVTERTDPICWMKPDAERTQEEALRPLNERNSAQKSAPGVCACLHPGVLQAVFLDGSAVFIPETIKPDLQKQYITGISAKKNKSEKN